MIYWFQHLGVILAAILVALAAMFAWAAKEKTPSDGAIWPPPPHGGDWSTRPDEVKMYGRVPPKPANFQAPPPVIPPHPFSKVIRPARLTLPTHPLNCPCCHNGISGY